MTELLAHLPSDDHYQIQFNDTRNSNVKLFAPHGGCIEPGTGILVRELACDNFDYYVFQGMMKKNCFGTLHISSTRYDEPCCHRMARQSMLALAIHGCDTNKEFIEVGGGSTELVTHLYNYLVAQGFPAGRASGHRKGKDKRNFINQAKLKGIQLELSTGFRKELFHDFPRTYQCIPKVYGPFIHAMQHWLQHIESTIA